MPSVEIGGGARDATRVTRRTAERDLILFIVGKQLVEQETHLAFRLVRREINRAAAKLRILIRDDRGEAMHRTLGHGHRIRVLDRVGAARDQKKLRQFD